MEALHPPMELGQILKGVDDQGNLINDDKLGMIWKFPTFSTTGNQRGGKSRPGGGRCITAVCLRNTSGITLLGKRFGLIDVTAGYGGVKNVTGYNVTRPKKNVVLIDPFLAATGVLDDEIFWAIISGPVLVLTPTAGADFGGADIAVGDSLVAATGTTSGNSTGGRVALAAIANATDATGAFAQALACVGRALSARTTGETAADLLVDLNIQSFGR